MDKLQVIKYKRNENFAQIQIQMENSLRNSSLNDEMDIWHRKVE